MSISMQFEWPLTAWPSGLQHDPNSFMNQLIAFLDVMCRRIFQYFFAFILPTTSEWYCSASICTCNPENNNPDHDAVEWWRNSLWLRLKHRLRCYAFTWLLCDISNSSSSEWRVTSDTLKTMSTWPRSPPSSEPSHWCSSLQQKLAAEIEESRIHMVGVIHNPSIARADRASLPFTCADESTFAGGNILGDMVYLT